MFTKFAANLRKLRESKNWSRKELAEILDISVSLLIKWESTNPADRRDPSTEYLMKLADLFDVSVDYLLGRTDIPLASSENDIFNDIDKNIREILDIHGIPIGNERYSMEELEAIIKMIKNFKNMI